MTQDPPDIEIFNDLQQFLYDARDQFLALEHIRNDLMEIAETSVSQRQAVAATAKKLDQAIKDGMSVTVNAGLDRPTKQLAQATADLHSIVSSARREARRQLYTIVTVTSLTSFTATCLGLYVTLRVL